MDIRELAEIIQQDLEENKGFAQNLLKKNKKVNK